MTTYFASVCFPDGDPSGRFTYTHPFVIVETSRAAMLAKTLEMLSIPPDKYTAAVAARRLQGKSIPEESITPTVAIQHILRELSPHVRISCGMRYTPET